MRSNLDTNGKFQYQRMMSIEAVENVITYLLLTYYIEAYQKLCVGGHDRFFTVHELSDRFLAKGTENPFTLLGTGFVNNQYYY